MKRGIGIAALALSLVFAPVAAFGDDGPDPDRDILVTFDDDGAGPGSAGANPPYRFRKRYSISGQVRRLSQEVAAEYGLSTIDHWPIRSLSVYCFVYRVPEGRDRREIIEILEADARVESAQLLQRFETSVDTGFGYNDPYLKLQHGLQLLGIVEAHQVTRGEGVRVAIIDSGVDLQHEDLEGRIGAVEMFAGRDKVADVEHGTAIAGIIGANADNARGIVGVAPAVTIDVLVSCWTEGDDTICDSFTLAKAMDYVLGDPPEIVNFSLAGPKDPLVGRLIETAVARGVIVVAARPDAHVKYPDPFPASIPGVLAIAQSELIADADLSAPGQQIVVALPDNRYEVRSGSSLSAAHATGVVALMLSVAPHASAEFLRKMLRYSQLVGTSRSIDACVAMHHADAALCELPTVVKTE